MIFGIGDDGAEPVEEVEDVRPADAGKKILVPAGKSDDLVRKDGADDDELVVVEDGAVDRNGHVHLEQAAGELADLACRDRAEGGKGGGVVPGVVEDADPAVLAGPLLGGDFQAAVDRLVAHRRMGAQGDHHVEGFGFAPDEIVNDAEEQADGGGARGVGDDQQHLLAGEAERGEGLGGDIAHLRFGEAAVGQAGVDRLRLRFILFHRHRERQRIGESWKASPA